MAAQDAIDEFIALPRDQQMTTLQSLSPEKQDKLLGKIKERRSAKATPAEIPIAPAGPKERTVGNYADEGIRGVGRGLMNDVSGVGQLLTHPIDTVEGLMKQANESGAAAGKEFRDLKGVPMGQRLGATALAGLEKAPMIGGMVQHAEEGGDRMASPEGFGATMEGITTFAAPELAGKMEGITTFAAPELAGKMVGPMVKGLKNTSDTLRKAATGTGTSVTKDLVAKTQAGNALGDAHIKAQAAIETARNNALKEGNAKYSAVNEKLSHLPADMDKLQGAYADAAQSFGETQGIPPIIKRLEGPMNEPLTYADEQKLYSELGKELSKGTLPGTTYHAYDVLQEAVGADMQRIADSQGAGAELTGARNYWRRMKQTFGKPLGEHDVANSVLRAESPEAAQHGETANRIRLLGSFDPEIPKAFSELQKARAAGKDTGATATAPGETSKITPGEIRVAKAEKLAEKANRLATGRSGYANTIVAYDIIRNAMHGNVEGIAMDLAVRGIYGLGKKGMARLLENPKVVDLLTKPTPADLALIPPELRADFPEIIEAAKAHGIKVHPRMIAAFKGAGTAASIVGPKTKELQNMRNRGFVETGTDRGNAQQPQ